MNKLKSRIKTWIVWKKSIELAEMVYTHICGSFLPEEKISA